MKPTVLIATTCCWFPTARLVMALANAGCTVDAVCPSHHPLGKTSAVRHIHRFRGLMPVKSFADAITAAKPDFIIPGDDLATQQLHKLYARELRRGKSGEAICALIEHSLGANEHFSVLYARADFIHMAEQEGVRVPRTEVIAGPGDLGKWITKAGFPVVLKANGTSGGDGVKVVHTLEEANKAFRKLQAPPLLAKAAKRTLMDDDSTLIWPSLLRENYVVNGQAFVAGRQINNA